MNKHQLILFSLIFISKLYNCAPIGTEQEVESVKRQFFPINQQLNPSNQFNPNIPINVAQNQQPPYWQVNSQNPNNLNLIHNNQYWPGPDPQIQQQQQQQQQQLNQNPAKAYVYPLKPVFPEFITTTTTTTTTQQPPETASVNPDDVPLYSKSFNPYDRETDRPTPLTPQALWYSRYADLTVPIAAVPFNTWNNI